ncbi:alpha/beta fold hydrolase [Mycoplasma sp. 'Moose RK']|uniref:alpha/beta fold hydrolase n=1 Tax=Mycoplasma sp. 'Moose RK' TaxID=2780095 RepID=UPI0018C212A1|nr:alpha/beta hydrolase [Mycoplasma sp. 'Moose RK']MBG0730968.1 alpha/beta hydrolase [Mycoplasma sp. 'Moose RK']
MNFQWKYPFVVNYSPFNKINIVFCHGFNSNHMIFFEAAARIKGANYYSFTLPGNNLTPATDEQLSMEYYANLIVEFIKKLGIKDVILVGHSMGAGNAALVYHRIPELISKIVFIGPMNKANLPLAPLFYEKFFPKTPSEMLEFLTIYEYDKEKFKNPKYQKWAENVFDYNFYNNDNIVKLGKHLPENMDRIEAGIATVKCPALLVLGENDGIVLQKETKSYYQKLIPSIQVEIIPKTGHLIYTENPDYFNNIFQSFLLKK